MTDRYKGFLVTLDKEIRSDDAEYIINALKMIRGVHSVKPYIKGMEDYMIDNEEEKFIDDPILERIHHQLFHLVMSIDKMTEKIEYLAEMTHELGVEIYKYRSEKQGEN